jgi:2-polyprenyl-6-methoxyphenol hydroxylase-like FAD-dependent oxidoreductase
MTEVIVVGGGIVGLSAAYALVKAGVGVTLVEQGPIPNPLASSADHDGRALFSETVVVRRTWSTPMQARRAGASSGAGATSGASRPSRGCR